MTTNSATTGVSGDASNNQQNIGWEPDAISLIRDCAFSPAVAVLTSFDVETLCEKNNLSFCELLLPFTQLASEAALKDPNNQNILIKHLRLDFRDLRRDGYAANIALPAALEELLRKYQPATTISKGSDGIETNSVTGTDTPWYDAYTRQFLRLLDPPEYEFNRHYLACILVVSTAHDDPLDQFNRLSQAQHALQHQQQTATSSVQLPKYAATPKWFSPNTFKYHLLVHDAAEGDDRKAESVYQGMKMNYSAHACHLLRINSVSSVGTTVPVSSNIWTPFVCNRLRHFNNLCVHEDQKPIPNENNNSGDGGSGHAPSSTVVNGDTVLVGAHQGLTDPTTISHTLSSSDLQLENQKADAVEKEERMQTIVYGQCMTSSDIDRVRIFVQEFSVRGLLPYVERQLRLLNEQVVARRGLHKTFLSFTKNLWGKSGTSGSTPNLQNMSTISSSSSGTFGYVSASSSALPSPEKSNSTGVITQPQIIAYPYESAEMQTRRLADLAALFQNYELAYQLYHSLKKEFGTAQAWIHSASAMEFASLCIFLSGATQSRPYPSHYMDQAINTYLAIPENPLLASRASIYSTAILRATSDYGQAASQYIRLSSGDDLRSALFLEQAALCFIRAGLQRKAALHLILAGHRYGKAAKRQHTIRCYEAAMKSYYGKGWKYALDHIFSTLGEEANEFPSEDQSSLKRNQPSASRRSASGFSKMPQSSPSPDLSMKAKLRIESPPEMKQLSISDSIHCSLVFQPLVEHDFISRGLCRVVIGLEINYSIDVEELLIRAYSGAMSSSPTEFQHFYRGYPLLLWSSTSRRVPLPTNGPSSENGFYRHRLDLIAMVTSPGIYDASSLKVSCRRKESSAWEDMPLLQSQFITVIQRPRNESCENPGGFPIG